MVNNNSIDDILKIFSDLKQFNDSFHVLWLYNCCILKLKPTIILANVYPASIWKILRNENIFILLEKKNVLSFKWIYILMMGYNFYLEKCVLKEKK